MPDDEIERILAQSEQTQDCLVLPANWPALRLFHALDTQWHYAGLAGVRVGLRYEAIEPVIRALPDLDQSYPELFARLRLIEAAAVRVGLKKKAKDG